MWGDRDANLRPCAHKLPQSAGLRRPAWPNASLWRALAVATSLVLTAAPGAALASAGCAAINSGVLSGTATFSGTGAPTDTGTVEGINTTAFVSDRATTQSFNSGDKIDFSLTISAGLYGYLRFNTPGANYNPGFQNTASGSYSQTLPSGVTKVYVFSGRTSTATDGSVVAAATCSPIAPTISSLGTASGADSGGTSVVINGVSFTGATSVKFGTTSASFIVDSDTQITATSPAGAGTVDVRVTNATGASTIVAADQFTYTPAALAVTPGAATGATVAASYSQANPASGGTSPYVYALASGTLPAGTSLNTATGAVTGTPTTAGAFSYAIKATDSAGTPATATGATVSGSIAKAAQTISFTGPGNTSISASPVTVSATAGSSLAVAFSSTTTAVCTVSGTSVTLIATGTCTLAADQAGDANWNAAPQVTRSFSVTAAALAVTPGAATGATVAASYSQANPASGGTSPYTYALASGALPAGTSLNTATGAVTGTPTTAGAFSYAIKATDSAGTPATATGATVSGSIAKAAQTISFTGPGNTSISASPITVSATAGSSLAVAFSSTTTAVCTVSGTSVTLIAAGTCTVAADQAGDANWNAAPQVTRSFSVTAAGPITITGCGGGLARGGACQLSAAGGAGPYSFSGAGNPAWVSVSGGGLVSISSSAPSGSVSFTVTATDSAATPSSGSTTLAFSIPGAAIVLSGQPGNGRTGEAYVASFSAAGGAGPYSFSGGGFPPGLSLSSTGALSGTPTTAGEFTLSVTAVDRLGDAGGGAFTIRIGMGPPVITGGQGGGQSGPDANSIIVPPPPVSGGASPPASTINLSAQVSGEVTGFTVITPPDHGDYAIGQFAAAAPKGAAAAIGGDFVLKYQPRDRFMGEDRVVLRAFGPGGQSATFTVIFQVAGVAPDLSLTVAANGKGTASPMASLIGGPFKGLVILSPPSAGVAGGEGLTLIYAPDATRLGKTSFTYAVDLGFGRSAAGLVSVTVTPAVVAARIAASTPAGRKLSVDLTTPAQGGPFSAATVLSQSPAGAGTAIVRAVGAGAFALDFTPADAFTGPVTLRYSLTAMGATAEADLVIDVRPRPDPGLDPELRGLLTATDEAVRAFARTQTDNFNQRLERLRGARAGGLDFGLRLTGPRDVPDPTRDGDRPGGSGPAGDSQADNGGGTSRPRPAASAAPKAAAQAPTAAPSPWGVWTAGAIELGHRDAAAQRRDYRLTTSGVSAGVDYRLSDRIVVGAGLGYGHHHARIGDSGSRLNGDSLAVAAYGGFAPRPGVFLDGVLGYGRVDFDFARYAAAGPVMLSGGRTGDLLFASLRGGLEASRGRLNWSPYGQISIIDGRLDGFTERGDDTYALRYAAQDLRSLASTLGVRVDWSTRIASAQLAPRLRAEWRHEFQSAGDQALTYADWAGSPRYGVEHARTAADDVSLELGAGVRLDKGLSLDLSTRAFLADDGWRNGVSLRLARRF